MTTENVTTYQSSKHGLMRIADMVTEHIENAIGKLTGQLNESNVVDAPAKQATLSALTTELQNRKATETTQQSAAS